MKNAIGKLMVISMIILFPYVLFAGEIEELKYKQAYLKEHKEKLLLQSQLLQNDYNETEKLLTQVDAELKIKQADQEKKK